MSIYGPKEYYIYIYYYIFRGLLIVDYVGHAAVPPKISDMFHKGKARMKPGQVDVVTSFRKGYRETHKGRRMLKRHNFKATTSSQEQALKWEQRLTKYLVKNEHPLMNDDLNQLDGKHGQRLLGLVNE